MRGCALGRRSAAIRVRARFVSLEPRSAPRAGRSQQGGHRHERAAALGLGGEAAGHARTKANTRRNARGGGLGEGAQPELRANVQQKGAVAIVELRWENLRTDPRKHIKPLLKLVGAIGERAQEDACVGRRSPRILIYLSLSSQPERMARQPSTGTVRPGTRVDGRPFGRQAFCPPKKRKTGKEISGGAPRHTHGEDRWGGEEFFSDGVGELRSAPRGRTIGIVL